MQIAGFLETSFVDWPGRICAVLFLAGCNFRCPYCHNHPLVLQPQPLPSLAFADIRQRLVRLRRWLGGVCVSGGEPTINAELAPALSCLKADGWPIKLDTNGSRPRVLRELLAAGLLDQIAMDVKAPLEAQKYAAAAGAMVDLAAIAESIAIIKESGIAHEFRMTVLPRLHPPEDIDIWAKGLARGRSKYPSRLKLQNFSPRSPLDPALTNECPFVADDFSRLQHMVSIHEIAQKGWIQKKYGNDCLTKQPPYIMKDYSVQRVDIVETTA